MSQKHRMTEEERVEWDKVMTDEVRRVINEMSLEEWRSIAYGIYLNLSMWYEAESLFDLLEHANSLKSFLDEYQEDKVQVLKRIRELGMMEPSKEMAYSIAWAYNIGEKSDQFSKKWKAEHNIMNSKEEKKFDERN